MTVNVFFKFWRNVFTSATGPLTKALDLYYWWFQFIENGGANIPGGTITGIDKARRNRNCSSADQNMTRIYWFLMKLQNVMINRIRRRGYNWSLQGLIPGGAVLYKKK